MAHCYIALALKALCYNELAHYGTLLHLTADCYIELADYGPPFPSATTLRLTVILKWHLKAQCYIELAPYGKLLYALSPYVTLSY
jgi:phage tail protein X